MSKNVETPMNVYITSLPEDKPFPGKTTISYKPKMVHSFKWEFPNGHQMTIRENVIDISSRIESDYCILLTTSKEFPAKGSAGAVLEILIDGIRHGSFLLRPEDCNKNFYLEGRRVAKDEVRCFQFKALRIEDYKGDYKMPKTLTSQTPSWLDQKKEVGIIRVNVYNAWDLKPMDKAFEGLEDLEPCAVVDEIGHIKLGEHIKSVTGLRQRKRCGKADVWDAVSSAYPFYSYVVRYGSEVDPKPTETLKAEKTTSKSADKKGGFKSVKRGFARVFCFGSGDSKPPSYSEEDDCEKDEPAPRYSEKASSNSK